MPTHRYKVTMLLANSCGPYNGMARYLTKWEVQAQRHYLESLASIITVAFMQRLWESRNNSRRSKDEIGWY